MSIDEIPTRLTSAIEKRYGPNGVRAFTSALETLSEKKQAAGGKAIRGANRSTVQRYLSGESPATVDFLAASAEVLRVDVEWLLTGREARQVATGFKRTRAIADDLLTSDVLPEVYRKYPGIGGSVDLLTYQKLADALTDAVRFGVEELAPGMVFGEREYNDAEFDGIAPQCAAMARAFTSVLVNPIEMWPALKHRLWGDKSGDRSQMQYLGAMADALRSLFSGPLEVMQDEAQWLWGEGGPVDRGADAAEELQRQHPEALAFAAHGDQGFGPREGFFCVGATAEEMAELNEARLEPDPKGRQVFYVAASEAPTLFHWLLANDRKVVVGGVGDADVTFFDPYFAGLVARGLLLVKDVWAEKRAKTIEAARKADDDEA